MTENHEVNCNGRGLRAPSVENSLRENYHKDHGQRSLVCGACRGRTMVAVKRDTWSERIRSGDAGTGSEVQEKETLEENLPSLFEPDTLLPIQYFETIRRKHLLEGEKRLVLSVLKDAIDCFMKCIDSSTRRGQRLFRDAEQWIIIKDKKSAFSFDNVCEMLEFDPEYMRRGLRNWKIHKLEAIEQVHIARRADLRTD